MGQCSCCRISIGTGVHCRVRGQREEKLKVDGDSDGDLSDPGGVGYKVAGAMAGGLGDAKRQGGQVPLSVDSG